MVLSYAIIGTGAVGGYYGGLLARSGREVHFLLHSDFDHVRRHGLVVRTKSGDFALPQVNAYARSADMPAVDVIVVATKSTGNHLLPQLMPPMRPTTSVLVLQNGIGPDQAVAALVGMERVLGGLCFLCSNKIGPGHIQHLDYGKISFGEYDPAGWPRGVTPRMAAIAADFSAAGVEMEQSPDLLLSRWKKLMWNIPFNGLSIVLDSATDRIMAYPHSRAMALDIMRDVIAAAAACGKTVPDTFADHMMDLTDRMMPYRSSMKIDFDEGRPTEVEAIFGNPLRAAQKAGHQPRLIEFLYRQIRFLETRRLGSAAISPTLRASAS